MAKKNEKMVDAITSMDEDFANGILIYAKKLSLLNTQVLRAVW